MKTYAKMLLLLTLGVLTIGCSTTVNPWQVNGHTLREGMTKAEVGKLCGSPKNTAANKWYYPVPWTGSVFYRELVFRHGVLKEAKLYESKRQMEFNQAQYYAAELGMY